jgi:hypothetical protein
MALILADRVKETTTTTGTGSFTLLGAVSGFQSFAAIGDTNTTYYTAVGRTTSEWEVGIGTYTASGTTLARTTVLSSSNSNAAVSFSAGTKDVFVTYPASRSINLDSTGNLGQAIIVGGVNTPGRLPVEQYYGLNSANVGANATGAQSVFGFGVVLPATLIYQFEGVYCFVKTAGTTSHTLGIGFGGTAGITNIGYSFLEEEAAGAVNGRYTTAMGCGFVITTSSTVVTGAIASAAQIVIVNIRGQVSCTSGSLIPQYTLSAAPGGAYTTQIGSYFKISPLSAAGANVSIGNWL